QVMPREWSNLDGGGNCRRDEPLAAVSKGETDRFGGSENRLDRRAVGFDAKIGIRKHDRRFQMRTCDRAPVMAAAEINPVVQSPLRTIDGTFQAADGKTCI